MIIVYSPEGEKRHVWNLRDLKVMSTEAEAIERLTDWTWPEAQNKLGNGSMLALRAVAFVLAKRDEPSLRYTQFNPPADELDYWLDAEERASMRDAISTSDKIDEDEREYRLDALDEVGAEMVRLGLEDAPVDAPEVVGEDVPKDSAPEASPTGESASSPGSATSSESSPGTSAA